jgi:penicillin V acylase-like amidase (Ntn superfamily)
MKKNLFRCFFLLLVAFWLIAPRAIFPCSTFVLRKGGKLLFGRNFDFFTGNGAIMVNPRGLVKTALVLPGENPAKWAAQYGSVTFNQVGRELPMGGMNEAGLVVEMMWHFTAGYPAPDARPALMELQWIQYQLDNCASIEDVARCNDRVRITPMGSRVHFLILDRGGRAAAVEFINGKTLFYSGKDLPVAALTNISFADSLKARSGFQGFGKTKALGTTINDPDRFVALAAAVAKPGKKKKLLARAFAILEDVHCNIKESPTQWRFVYDPRNLEIHIRTLNNPAPRTLRFRDFSFACTSGAKVLDLDAGSGDISKSFLDYSHSFNESLARKTFTIYKQAGFQKDMPDFYVAVLAGYPDSIKCQ